MRLWLVLCLLISTLVSAKHSYRGRSLAKSHVDEAGLSNAERMQKGLPLKKPVKRASRTYHAFQARASPGAAMQDVVVQATQSGARRRASTYLTFDAANNGFKLTSDTSAAAVFSVPGSTVGNTQVRLYTSDGLYYLGAMASQSTQGTFGISSVKASDLGNPSGSAVQTTIWSFAGVPGAMTGTFSYLDSTAPIYLSVDAGGVVIGTRDLPTSGQVTLSLQTISDVGVTVKDATPPADGGAPINSDPAVDPRLAIIDNAINGGELDDASVAMLLDCLTGTFTAECEALLATLPMPEQTP